MRELKFACIVMSASDKEIWVRALTGLITHGLLTTREFKMA